jgi:hypothetical protein
MTTEMMFEPMATNPERCEEGGVHALVYLGHFRDLYGRKKATRTYKCTKCGEYITKEMLGVENA